ncbi:histidine--tRNA ligase [Metamycoplasma hominis]|uniref:Histidine--tRNA ligase n=1 Tax=Metamycoplasma hominis (strain ATCC 23114 / DSM 25592 / NBRC 14850 / NCTC 10111 / PG21) TaxID=347256 RepID=D1J7X4_METH1|nr:histidine--tRNA ligase [Metamycoplasma hominis]MBD3898751.1 histidine--tRNA ligase [Metamycoplasma hominis]RAW47503.1 histidine--tRNA ligase [Metamycoplasma hominis]CAX37321.1 Histidyl-tRNA synthetase [Metamycoplasma hominis ATCC 23114]
MFQRLKGTRDIYGLEEKVLNLIENKFFKIIKNYNFKRICTPIIEDANLFIRSVGETSDIVSKEMYLFKDNGQRDIALRPEGTASTIRAFVENKINNLEPTKLAYFGPMFRYERPQKGRYRQFIQGGVELIENSTIENNFEIIKLAYDFLKSLKISNITLEINNLGSFESRNNYIEILKEYFSKYKEQLNEISLIRLQKNVLRILDDKEEIKKDFVKNAPKLIDYLSSIEKERFKNLLDLLDEFEIKYVINPYLVRGLDYYNDVVFEFVSNSDALGSQCTVLGGGRYDGMIKSFGGPDIGSIGFAFGVDRLMEIIMSNIDNYPELSFNETILIAYLNEDEKNEIRKIAYDLRRNFQVIFPSQKQSIKSLFKLQYKLQPKYLIFKELNMKKNELKIKSLLNERNIIYTNLDEFKNIISEMKRDENNE